MVHHTDEVSVACALPLPAGSVEDALLCCLPTVRRWARRKFRRNGGGHFDACDLVQEAALRLISHRDSFQPSHQDGVEAYMRQIVVNLIRDEARRKTRRPASVALADEYPCPDAGPFERTIDSEIRARYLRALRTLRPRDRAIVVARLELQKSAKEIALAFRLPTPAAAGMATRRALRRLRGAMVQ